MGEAVVEEQDIKKLNEKEIARERKDIIEKYLLWDNIYHMFTSGRRISHAIIIWFNPEEKENEKEEDV